MVNVLFVIGLSNDNPMTSFIIGFWPEYDHPGVLVSLQIQSDTTKLPFSFNLVVPENVKMVIETYMIDGEQKSKPVELISRDGNFLLPVTLTNQNYYAQFYFNPFTNNAEREMNFNLQADIDISNYFVVIQKHISDTEFMTNLINVESITDEFGLTYLRSKFDHLPAGTNQLIQIKYNNTENITTMDILNNIFSEMEHNHGEHSGNTEILTKYKKDKNYILLISSVMTILIIIGVVFLNRNTKKVDYFIYCGDCGEKIIISSKFCRKCGGKIVS